MSWSVETFVEVAGPVSGIHFIDCGSITWLTPVAVSFLPVRDPEYI